jgi:hypothetical protein
MNIQDIAKATKQELAQAVDEMVYQNYKYNRERAPEIAAERWVAVYGLDALLMELRLQKEYRSAK